MARWEILNHINLSPNIPASKKPKRVEEILRLPTDRQVKAEKIVVTDKVKHILKDVLKWD